MIRQRRLTGLLAVLMGAWSLYSCGSWAPVEDRQAETAPLYYRVRPGDTLMAIAWRYGLDYRQIAVWNNLRSADLILAGQRLRLWPNKRPSPSVAAQPSALAFKKPPARASNKPPARSKVKSAKTAAVKPDKPATPARAAPGGSSDAWRWPTEGKVVSRFSSAPGRSGIQISGRLGQPIHAVSPGEVVYSGSGIPNLGRLIIVQHSANLLSAYGYLGRMLVKEGDNVEAGQKIAELGRNDRDRPVLHFEVRRKGKPVNPLRYLPG